MVENDLFRKSTLERVSSPDKLNEYIKITNPSLIIMLLGIFSVLLAGCVWIFSGTIPKTVTLTGVVAENLDGEKKVYCYVPIATGKRLKAGMDVHISPDYADKEQYGYMKGTVVSVGDKVVTSEYAETNFVNPEIIYPTLKSSAADGNVVEIIMDMGKWSRAEGEDVEITEGTDCAVSVIVGGTKPYELIFNN